MNYDTVIVGGGISGLTNALLLAHFGQRVAVVECATTIAPLLRGFSRCGVHYDTGFHYAGGLGDGEVLDRFLRFLGLSSHLSTVPFCSEGFDRLLATDSALEFNFPSGEAALPHALSAEFPGERRAIETFVRDTLAVCDSLPYLNPQLRFAVESHFNISTELSLHDYLETLTCHQPLKKILSLHCLLHGVAPQHIPFRLHAAIIGPYFRSVHTFSGGGKALATAFEAVLKSAGVDLYCGQRLEKIKLSESGQVTGVELQEGRVLECRAVITTAHPKRLLDWLDKRWFRPVYRRRLDELQETSSAYLFFARCQRPVPLLDNCNIYLAKINGPTALCPAALAQRSLYLTAANNGSVPGYMGIMPACAQEVAAWQHSRRGQRGESYHLHKQKVSAAIVRQIEARVPELLLALESSFLATPLTLRDYMHSPDGAMYGTQHRVDQYPLQSTTRIKGLFISGQALFAPGLMGAMTSAFFSCGSIVGHQRVFEELNQCR